MSTAPLGSEYLYVTRTHARELERELHSARATAMYLASTHDHDRARELEHELHNAYALVRTLRHAHARSRIDPATIVGDLARDLASASELASDLDRYLGRTLQRAHTSAVVLAREFGLSGQEPNERGRKPGGRKDSQIASMAAQLTVLAAQLLPDAERARYAEEFQSELWDLAQAKASRRAQLAYAARQAVSAVRLRAALRTPARRGATP